MGKALLKTFVITNKLGLHARAAAKIAKIAEMSTSGVWLIRDDQPADATSVIDILSLACGKGSQLTVKIDDPKDKGILDAIVALAESGFGENKQDD